MKILVFAVCLTPGFFGLFDSVYRAAFRQPGDSALGAGGGGSAPTPTVDLKVSEKSAFGPPRGCASGSLWQKYYFGYGESFFIKKYECFI